MKQTFIIGILCVLATVLFSLPVASAIPILENVSVNPAHMYSGDVFTINADASASNNSTISYVELYTYGKNYSYLQNLSNTANNTYSKNIYDVLSAGKYNILVNAVEDDGLGNFSTASTTGTFTISEEAPTWLVIAIIILLISMIIIVKIIR